VREGDIHTDYSEHLKKEKNATVKQEELKKRAALKYGKESMTAEEFSIYCNYSSKTVKNILKELNKRAGNTLILDKNENNAYLIPPKIHSVLKLIITCNIIDSRNSTDISKVTKHYDKIDEKIKECLSAEDIQFLTESPAFKNWEIERELIKLLNNSILELFSNILCLGPTIKLSAFIEIIDSIRKQSEIVRLTTIASAAEEDIFTFSKKIYDDINFSVNGDNAVGKLFVSRNINDAIVNFCFCKFFDVHTRKDYGINMIEYYILEKHFGIPFYKQYDLKELEETLHKEYDYMRIAEKAKTLFNKEDPFENYILEQILNLTESKILSSYLTKSSLSNIQRIVTEANARYIELQKQAFKNS